jgi:hemerythrin-like domain-containing protein
MNQLLSKAVPSVTTMIRMDHTHVLSVFHKYKADLAPARKQALADLICTALEIHAQLEEEIFYPAMRDTGTDSAVVQKSVPEHDEMRRLISVLRSTDPGDAAYDRTLMELMRDVMHHVADEETTLLPDAERLMPDRLAELGAQMTKRRLQLAGPRIGEIALDTVRAAPAMPMVFAAGALLAGTYFASRAMRRTG